MYFKTYCLVYQQNKWAFYYILLHCIAFYDVGDFQNYMAHMYMKSTTRNIHPISVWPLGITGDVSKGFSMRSHHLLKLFVW